MSKNKKIIAIIFVISLVFLIGLLIHIFVIQPNAPVDSDTVKKWTDTYLDQYMNIVEENFGKQDGYYFDFYGKHPFKIKTVKSIKNGVAIEMIPVNDTTMADFIFLETNNKIEVAVFEKNLMNNTFIDYYKYQNHIDKLINWTYNPAIITKQYGNMFSDSSAITNHRSFLKLSENSDLLIMNSTINYVYFYHTYLKSDIEVEYWSVKNATETSLNHIKNSIKDTFIPAFSNGEFDNLLAIPEIDEKLREIKDKLYRSKTDDNYRYTEFDWIKDKNEVKKLAKKHNISNEYFIKIESLVNLTYSPPKDNNHWEGFEYAIGLFIIQSIVILIYFILKNRLEKLDIPSIFVVTASMIYLLLYSSYLTTTLDIFNKFTTEKMILGFVPFVPLIMSFIWFLIHQYIKNNTKQR